MAFTPVRIQRSRSLRATSTEAEIKLWRLFRSRRLSAMKWRRQVPVGRYIAEFLCFEHRIIVECDGSQHPESARDLVRASWFVRQGFTIVRFWNHEILETQTSVIETILARAGLWF